MPVWMPRLLPADEIEARRVHFLQARDDGATGPEASGAGPLRPGAPGLARRHGGQNAGVGCIVDGLTPTGLTRSRTRPVERSAGTRSRMERAVRVGNLQTTRCGCVGAHGARLGAQHELHRRQRRAAARRVAPISSSSSRAAIEERGSRSTRPRSSGSKKAAATGADRRAAELARAHNWRTLLHRRGGAGRRYRGRRCRRRSGGTSRPARDRGRHHRRGVQRRTRRSRGLAQPDARQRR